MPLRPLSDKVLVRPIAADAQTKGGIVLPSIAQSERSVGLVVSVGPKVSEVNPGQKVLFTRFGGQEVQYPSESDPAKEETLIIMREDDVHAIEE